MAVAWAWAARTAKEQQWPGCIRARSCVHLWGCLARPVHAHPCILPLHGSRDREARETGEGRRLAQPSTEGQRAASHVAMGAGQRLWPDHGAVDGLLGLVVEEGVAYHMCGKGMPADRHPRPRKVDRQLGYYWFIGRTVGMPQRLRPPSTDTPPRLT